MRFRRSVKLIPGVRLNFSGSGVSTTIGRRGASVTFGRRGTYLNAGIPGTGISTRQRVGGSSSHTVSHTTNSPRPQVRLKVTARVDDDGVLHLEDESGVPLPENLARKAKQQQRDAIRALLAQQAKQINDEVDNVRGISIETPPPTEAPRFEPRAFEEKEPARPQPRKTGILGLLFKGWVKRIERLNREAEEQYQHDHLVWESALKDFKESEVDRQDYIENRIRSDAHSMEEFLDNSFQEIHWPVETYASFELAPQLTTLRLDLHLPEPATLPHRRATVPESRWNVSVKELSERDKQTLYARYAHGAGFRLVGEAFAALQTVSDIVLSAFAERPDPATATNRDECLYSVKISRASWSRINFNALMNLDPAAALQSYAIREKVSAAGVFSAIEPFK